MGIYTFQKEQHLKVSIDEIWDFISSPANLQKITPPSMGFDVRTANLPDKMYPGMMIKYKVKPLAGVPITWLTEITHVEEGRFFVDEQRSGPYSIWHHEHHLIPQNEGVLMRDIITYKPPFGILGSLVNPILIKPQLEKIFSYRWRILEERFNG